MNLSRRPNASRTLLSAVATLIILHGVIASASAQNATEQDFIQLPENFSSVSPTVPNEELDFSDDNNNSCCTRVPGKQRAFYRVPKNESEVNTRLVVDAINEPGSQILVECNKYAGIVELVSNQSAPPTDITVSQQADIGSRNGYMLKDGNLRVTNANWRSSLLNRAKEFVTSSFHVSAIGGSSHLDIQDVSNYSVCMARGSNVLDVRNTDNGSLLTYNGADHVHLAGNNTNMLTRTGNGNDVIEVEQADPLALNADASPAFRGEKWTANNVYRTAISGWDGIDTLALSNTPLGTKWCHIGDARVFGETFHIVEFALPPSAVKGPRRQRISIGNSMEYVVFNGKRYTLEEFLNNGAAAADIARALGVPEDNINTLNVADPTAFYGTPNAGRYNDRFNGQPIAMPAVTTNTPVRGLY
ncbi:MAG: hypothetical protein QE263_04315 [Vampirovibrionales bacterium]|nr:hypothetical protein [Vampirovibrionales bacterium]